MTFLYPEIRALWVTRLLASVVARVSFPAAYDPSDVLVGAEAVNAFDGREILPTNCTLELYKGKDHLGTMSDKRLSRDVLEFVRHPRPLRP
jgi:hypothetical protein